MTQDRSPATPPPRWRNSILFIGFPLLLILGLGWYAIVLAEEKIERQAALDMERRLQQLGQTCAPALFFSREFTRLLGEMEPRAADPAALITSVANWNREFGQNLEAWCFDASGTPRCLTPGMNRAEQAGSQVWAFLMTGQEEYKYRLFTNSALRELFGRSFAFDECMQYKGTVLPISHRGRPGYLYWNTSSRAPLAGVLFFLWETPSLQSLAERFRGILGSSEVALVFQPADESLFRSQPLETSLPEGRRLSDLLWTSFRIEKWRVFAGIPRGRLQLTLERRLLPVLIVLAGLGLFLLTRRRGDSGRPWFLTIRWKLTGLFLYAIALPLVGVGVLGTRLLYDREQVLGLEAMKAAQDYLLGLDSDFLDEWDRMLQRFRTIRDDPLLKTGLPAWRARVAELEKQKLINWLEIRDIHGDLLMTTESQQLMAQIGVMARGISRHTIDRHLSDRLGGLREKLPGPAEVMVQGVMESPIMGWASMYERPDQLHSVRFGGHEVIWYWDVYRDPTHPAAVIQGDTRVGPLIDFYLNKRLQQRHGHSQTAFRIMAWDPTRFRWLPAGQPVASEVRGLADRVALAREVIQDRVSLDGSEYLALGFPGKHLQNVVLIALFPDDEIRQALSSLREGVAVGIGVTILLALLLARAFAGTFLDPIGELTRGVVALHRRDTDVRLSIEQRDEFGDLALVFNQTIGDIKDMLFAREIQEKMIPQEPPLVPGYSLALANLPAADLGGDYCDALRMGNGKVLLVIGDVTGHGVSSSLLMAMAKALVFRFAQEGEDLCRLMERLNVMVARILQRKKMLTLFACILDPGTGEVQYATAGHPFPLVLRAHGELERLNLVHTPLGFRERCEPFQMKTMTLGPGDLLLLYTDGILEARNANNEFYGKRRLEDQLRRTATQVPAAVKDVLLADVQAFQQMAEDDLTVVVLKRDSLPPSPGQVSPAE